MFLDKWTLALKFIPDIVLLSHLGLPVLGVGFTGSLASTHPKRGDHRYWLICLPFQVINACHNSERFFWIVYVLNECKLKFLPFSNTRIHWCKIFVSLVIGLHSNDYGFSYMSCHFFSQWMHNAPSPTARIFFAFICAVWDCLLSICYCHMSRWKNGFWREKNYFCVAKRASWLIVSSLSSLWLFSFTLIFPSISGFSS